MVILDVDMHSIGCQLKQKQTMVQRADLYRRCMLCSQTSCSSVALCLEQSQFLLLRGVVADMELVKWILARLLEALEQRFLVLLEA